MPSSGERRKRGVIVLAAGASRRFGPEDKLLEPLDGRALCEAAFARAAGVEAEQCLATVSSPEVAELAQKAGLEPVQITAGKEQSASLKAGLRALSPTLDEVLILLADMPWVSRADIDALIATGAPACARLGPARMPPVLLPISWIPEILRVEADQGARGWLSRIPGSHCLALPEDHLRDVDRPEDLSENVTE